MTKINTKAARAEWAQMTGEQQYNALVAMAWTVRRGTWEIRLQPSF